MKSLQGVCIFLIFSIILCYNPLIIWTSKNLGDSWKSGTEIIDEMDNIKFTSLLREIIQVTVKFII